MWLWCAGGALPRCRHEQPDLIRRIAQWLLPGGWLLATVGHEAWTGTEDNWLGGQVPMWWCQADAGTYQSWLDQAVLTVTAQDFVPEGTSGHALFWAQRPASFSRDRRPANPSTQRGPASSRDQVVGPQDVGPVWWGRSTPTPAAGSGATSVRGALAVRATWGGNRRRSAGWDRVSAGN